MHNLLVCCLFRLKWRLILLPVRDSLASWLRGVHTSQKTVTRSIGVVFQTVRLFCNGLSTVYSQYNDIEKYQVTDTEMTRRNTKLQSLRWQREIPNYSHWDDKEKYHSYYRYKSLDIQLWHCDSTKDNTLIAGTNNWTYNFMTSYDSYCRNKSLDIQLWCHMILQKTESYNRYKSLNIQLWRLSILYHSDHRYISLDMYNDSIEKLI